MQQFLVHFIWALKYDHDHRTPLYVQCTIGHYMLNLNFVRINRLQQKCHWSFLRGKIPNLLAKWCNHSLPPKKYINDSIQKIGWKALIRSESFITFDSQKGLLKTLRWRWRVHSLLTQAHHSLALAISPVLCRWSWYSCNKTIWFGSPPLPHPSSAWQASGVYFDALVVLILR